MLLAKAMSSEKTLKRLLINLLQEKEIDNSIITEINKNYHVILQKKHQVDNRYSEEDIERSLVAMENQTSIISREATKAVRSIDVFDSLLKQKLSKLNL